MVLIDEWQRLLALVSRLSFLLSCISSFLSDFVLDLSKMDFPAKRCLLQPSPMKQVN